MQTVDLQPRLTRSMANILTLSTLETHSGLKQQQQRRAAEEQQQHQDMCEGPSGGKFLRSNLVTVTNKAVNTLRSTSQF